jgi:hypothetical protein
MLSFIYFTGRDAFFAIVCVRIVRITCGHTIEFPYEKWKDDGKRPRRENAQLLLRKSEEKVTTA